jgi:hypothetical protein
VTVEREEHPPKHSSQSRSTDDGIEIDESDEQSRKAASAMRESFEPESNVTLEREEQSLKHSLQSRSTDVGRKIDKSDEHP